MPEYPSFELSQVGKRIDKAIQQRCAGALWGSVLVAHGDEVLLAKGYGYADYLEAPITPLSLFEIASISKWFTAAAIMRLESEAKLSRHDSITKYFGCKKEKESMTIHHLLTHSSGISHDDCSLPYNASESRAEFLDLFMKAELQFPPGEKHEYSNVAYAGLAALIELVSEKTFEEYMKTQIFQPAEMFDTAFISDQKLDGSRAVARLDNDGKLDGTALDWYWSWGYKGMGGVVTTTYDLYKWNQALKKGIPLSKESQAKQTAPFLDQAASGCFVDEHYGAKRIYNTGSVSGFSAALSIFPDNDLLIAILGNANTPIFDIEDEIVRVTIESYDIKPDRSQSLSLECGGTEADECVDR